ncbi:MAG: tRNA (adenosine(37)-N6)-threonylcarbamoyltransferase complex transferase subunit TsaD [Proteobacteria bacterium]|nr:tRNA (adenosine(37)-N6)-threonylcarbamoyltransferase complex transferase subunit TsaD [Pseudomonadota bacterium]
MTTILAIETSCDETAAAVVEDGMTVRSSIIVSQEALHRRWGGVVPELASREHSLHIAPAVRQALEVSGTSWSEIDAVAVTHGPGLAGALVVGVNFAKAVAAARSVPLVPVNHLEGHLYANWLDVPGALVTGVDHRGPEFPVLCLVVSGGHTELVVVRGHGDLSVVGRTRDDAAGEAFDKVARILGLGYPGGPAIQAAAMLAPSEAAADAADALTRPWMRGTLDFSFSGLKTAMLRQVEGDASNGGRPVGNPSRMAGVAKSVVGQFGEIPERTARLARAFQEAVVDVLVSKTCDAAERFGAREVVIAGGVAANLRLREALVARSNVPVRVPPLVYCTDNAAMIGAAGYFRLQLGHVAGTSLDIRPGLRLDDPNGM